MLQNLTPLLLQLLLVCLRIQQIVLRFQLVQNAYLPLQFGLLLVQFNPLDIQPPLLLVHLLLLIHIRLNLRQQSITKRSSRGVRGVQAGSRACLQDRTPSLLISYITILDCRTALISLQSLIFSQLMIRGPIARLPPIVPKSIDLESSRQSLLSQSPLAPVSHIVSILRSTLGNGWSSRLAPLFVDGDGRVALVMEVVLESHWSSLVTLLIGECCLVGIPVIKHALAGISAYYSQDSLVNYLTTPRPALNRRSWLGPLHKRAIPPSFIFIYLFLLLVVADIASQRVSAIAEYF